MIMMAMIRRYLISGLLFWVPIWITLLIFKFLIDLLDSTFKLLPHAYQPDNLLGFHIPGLGIIFTLVVLFFTGMFVANFLGRHLMIFWNSLIAKIPLVRTIYLGVQKILTAVFHPKGKAFRKVLLVEYPRKGLWSIAFQTGCACKEVCDQENGDMVSIFIPTTPNPTSGFLMMIPVQDVRELDMTIDEALKFVISLGVVQPEQLNITKVDTVKP
jgi:uncharacterized membrane protein